MRIITIVGARPQFIKASAVSWAIQRYNRLSQNSKIEEIIIHTGQHYDENINDIFWQQLNIPKPYCNLAVGSHSHAKMTAEIMLKLEPLLEKLLPDIVLVYGDTNSTLAAALVAAKLLIPVAHVEAGLRSFNRDMPEEVNRILTDHLSKYLFCPTQTAVDHLADEGISNKDGIFVKNVGDVMYDIMLTCKEKFKLADDIKRTIERAGKRFYLVTLHRPSNVDNTDVFQGIINALLKISEHIAIIFPVHPRTKKNLININSQNLFLIDPVGYYDMMVLLSSCDGVLTDSGGLSKEAYFFQKPSLILREETEWVELVENGCSQLVGSDPEKIITAEQKMFFKKLDFSQQYFGDGQAADKIVEILRCEFGC